MLNENVEFTEVRALLAYSLPALGQFPGTTLRHRQHESRIRCNMRTTYQVFLSMID